jgi:hypothetical protein
MEEITLTTDQEQEAAILEDLLAAKFRPAVRQLARLLTSRKNSELFGETEFQIRDALHRLGADSFDAALAERKKRGTRDRARSAPPADKTPASKATATVR